MKTWMPVTGALSASLLLAGCASLPEDRGGSVATELLATRSDTAASVPVSDVARDTQSEVAKVLATPLDVTGAVRVALLQNPRMRLLYSELGLAQAEVYDASRLSNPSLGYMQIGTADAGTKTTWSLSQSFTELLFIGYRTRVSRSQLLQAQQRVADDVLALEAEVRSAYYQYVSADLVARMRGRMAGLAKASAQYAQQLFDAGNISALQLSREQAQASETAIAQRMADVETKAAQAKLMTLLNLPLEAVSKNHPVQFVTTLSIPQPLSGELPSLQTWAQQQRLDLAALREQATMFDANLKQVRRWRWLGGVQLDVERESESAGEAFTGVGGAVELPLFNAGGGNLLRARTGVEATHTRLAALQLEISNDIAVRYSGVQTAQIIIDEYRQRLVPLRERIVALSQQQQTFMLIGTFELIEAKQQEMDTYQAYLEAVRDYWIAHSELLRAAGGKLPEGMQGDSAAVSVGIDALDNKASADDSNQPMQHMDHSGHDMSKMQPSSGDKP